MKRKGCRLKSSLKLEEYKPLIKYLMELIKINKKLLVINSVWRITSVLHFSLNLTFTILKDIIISFTFKPENYIILTKLK